MKKVRIGLVAACMAFLLAVSGCSLGEEKWVAKVNEETITLKEYNLRLDKAQQAYKTQGMDFSTEQGKQALPYLKSQLLTSMVDARLISQEVKNLGLDSGDAKVKEQMDSMKAQFGDSNRFNDTLSMQGITEQELADIVALRLYAIKDIKVSDNDVQAFFDKNKEMYDQPEQVKAKHILVKTEDEAKAIIAQLDSSKGANFDQLAKEKSTDTATKDNGGDLGYFAKERMVPEFSEAAFSQQVGTYSKTPVKTEFGFHIIFVEDHKQAVAADFSKIKDQVAVDALNEAQSQKFQEVLTSLQSKAKVEYAEGYKPAA